MKLLLLSGTLTVVFLWSCQSGSKAMESKRSALGVQAIDSADGKRCGLGVVGGVETQGYPYVGLLVAEDESSVDVCTGTFIGHNVMLTASHCLLSDNPQSIAYINKPPATLEIDKLDAVAKTAIKPKKIIIGNLQLVREKNIANLKRDVFAQDLAILIFPDRTAPATVPVMTQSVSQTDKVSVVGYGRTEIFVAENEKEPLNTVKRIGSNFLLKFDPEAKKVFDTEYTSDLYVIGGATTADGKSGSTKALPGQGDSGGPLLLGEAVVAVTSLIQTVPPELKSYLDNVEAFAAFPKLQSAFALDLFKKAEASGAAIQYVDQVQNAPTSGKTTTERSERPSECPSITNPLQP